MKVGIVGMGYVGLPLACAFAGAGVEVVGFDKDQSKVDKLTAGESYLHHLSSEVVGGFVKEGLLRATSDFSQLTLVQAILICVPTPLGISRTPDLTYIEQTGDTIAKYLAKDQLVVLESTTYPGTTKEVLLPKLEAGGMECGKDFFLAYSPEREDPGNPEFTVTNIPKVVGGMTEKCGVKAAALYGKITTVHLVGSTEVAESCKILENTYRAVNIALVNEFKVLFTKMGINIWEVIEAASTKPFGFQPFYPGPGVAGHCLPCDSFYLTWKARQYGVPTKFIELAGDVNDSMPEYIVNRLIQALSHNAKALSTSSILLIGMAYKPGIDDARESATLKIMELLRGECRKMEYHDPLIPSIPSLRDHPNFEGMKSVEKLDKVIGDYDAVVIVTDQTGVDYDMVAKYAHLVVDARNALGQRSNVVQA